jgi:predicted AlkP superfamily pyrophosphatase or phosphodiesterase
MSKVILVLIDGCRPDAIEAASTPAIDRLIASGASTMTARTVEPPITLPAHFSLFTSLNPRDHNVTTNTGSPSPSSTVCSIVETVKNHRLKAAAVYSWELLRNLAPPSALDASVYLSTDKTSFTDLDIMEYAVRLVTWQLPDFCFIYLEGVDQAGHQHGWMSVSYLSAVEQADAAIGVLMQALADFGLTDDYAIILQSDHGGIDHHHLEPENDVLTIPWIVCAKGIRQGYTIQSTVSILDTAPTIARLMGLPPHYSWKGRMPLEIVADASPDNMHRTWLVSGAANPHQGNGRRG